MMVSARQYHVLSPPSQYSPDERKRGLSRMPYAPGSGSGRFWYSGYRACPKRAGCQRRHPHHHLHMRHPPRRGVKGTATTSESSEIPMPMATIHDLRGGSLRLPNGVFITPLCLPHQHHSLLIQVSSSNVGSSHVLLQWAISGFFLFCIRHRRNGETSSTAAPILNEVVSFCHIGKASSS